MGWDTGNNNPFGPGTYGAQTNPYANQPPGTVPTGAPPGTPPGAPPPGGYPGAPQFSFATGPAGVGYNSYDNFGRWLGTQGGAPPPGGSPYGQSPYAQYSQYPSYGAQTPGAPGAATTQTQDPQLSSFDGTVAMESNLTIDEVKQLAKKNKPELGNSQGITVKDLDGAIAEMEKSGDPDKAKKLKDMNALKNYINKQSGKSGDKKTVSDFGNMDLESGLSTSDINTILGREEDAPVNAKDIKKAYSKLKKGDVDSEVLDELDATGETEDILKDMKTAYKKLGGKEGKLDSASNAFEENADALNVFEKDDKAKSFLCRMSGGEISGTFGGARTGSVDGLKKISKMSVEDIKKELGDGATDADAKKIKDAAKFIVANKELTKELGGEDGKFWMDGNGISRNVAGGRNNELGDLINDREKVNGLGKKSTEESSESSSSSSEESSSEEE